MRIALLATNAKIFYTCPHIWSLEQKKAGSLFVVKDHANISASSPGIGPNINEYGPRFYDITHMYHTALIEALTASLTSKKLDFDQGELFWVNNSSLPDRDVFLKLSKGLSNERVSFKGIVKSGVAELMAV